MSCPNPYANLPDQNFTDSDWKQAVANVDPGGGDSFGGDGGGEAAIAGTKIPFNKLQSFYRYWLGYSGCSLGSGGATNGIKLQRTLPLRHPYYQDLSADAAHAVPFVPDAQPYTGSLLSGLKRFVQSSSQIPTVPAFTGWILAKATIGFRDVPYELVDDSIMGDPNNGTLWSQPADAKYNTPAYSFPSEWLRFTEFDPAPKVEALAIDGFTMIYADGSGNNPPTTNPKGITVAAPVGQLLVKADLSLLTYRLPDEFLFEPASILPRNILLGLGKVNRYDLFGQKAGTLLFTGVEMKRRRFSLRVPDGFATWKETRYLWQVRFLFSFFDPPTGLNNGESYTTSQYRGHNLLFYLGGRNTSTGAPSSGDKNSMKWFFATATGSPSDPGLLPTFDHAQLWWPVSNTNGSTNPVYS